MTDAGAEIFRIVSAALRRFPAVTHAFLGRTGGVSAGRFFSLNMSPDAGDRMEDVHANRDAAGREFGFDPRRLVTLTQVHGNAAVAVEDLRASGRGSAEADAVITALGSTAVGVLTADCLPLLFLDPVKNAIGAAHAGWRGTVKHVAMNAVIAMRERFGSNPADILASLGPCIGPCCYTVGRDVEAEFEKAFGKDAGVCVEKRGGRAVDLAAANHIELRAAGVAEKNISREDVCTSCNSNVFFSHRKSGGDTGRQLSFIMLR